MKQKTWDSPYFYGYKISNDSKRAGYLSYHDMAAPWSMVLANSLRNATYDTGYWELENGSDVVYMDADYNEIDEDTYNELLNSGKECYEDYLDVYQEYVVEPAFVTFLEEFTDELVWYNDELDLYIWGVCHWGTPWSGVSTSIKLEGAALE